MVQYKQLGYNNFEEYYEDFQNNLLFNNHTYNYFVDWDKVFNKIKEYMIEISILNTLSKVDEKELESTFKKIILTYPEVVPILPSILAIRKFDEKKKIYILDDTFKTYDFSADGFNPDEIVNFANKTGLLKLFNKINDLYAYLLGTEVGLDSNARKNRSGTIFESIIEEKLKEKLENTPYEIKVQEMVEGIIRVKRADFIISLNNKQLIIIECNFYSSTGSKPIEVTNAYKELQKEVDKTNVKFLWITDGIGWKKMKKTIKNGMETIDYIINYSMLSKTIDILLDL
ncbi:type II restriction endonuclease [Methanosphaera sp. WGK6]|uniref:type II restriction endonuclease n=1 Tax=Methanosphaera sp. WGK6 TaxID=1561964 RepID=UPI000A00BA21|nr:type II restriction endonuclease [Methanosphaera sp. WGK6]